MVNNGGITSPGNSPGVLPIVGNYTENGTLVIEIGGLGGAGVNPTGYDQVAVGGTTTLNPAGSVLQIVKFTAFEPAKGDTFQIINGTPGSIHGHFGALTTSFINDLVFILGTGELIGTGQAAGSPILGAFPGATDNQKRILASLQVVDHQFAGGDLLPLLLNAGNSTTTTSLIFAKASPEAYAGLTDYALRATQSYRDAAGNLSPLVQSGRFSLFAGYNSLEAGSDSSRDRADYTLRSNGGLAGVRFELPPHWTAGFFAGFDSGSVRAPFLRGDVTGSVYGLFASYEPRDDHRLVFDVGLDLGSYSTKGTRITASSNSLFPKVALKDYTLSACVKYVAVANDNYSLQPEIRFSYSNAVVDGFSEINATTPEALHVVGQSTPSLRLDAAINGSAKVSDRFSLTARLGVAHDFEQSSRDVLANVVGEPTVFSVRAPGMGQTEIKLGLGVNIIVAPRFTLRLSYQAGFAGDAQNDNAFFIGGSFGF